MLNTCSVHYKDVKYNEHTKSVGQSLAWHHYKSMGRSLACLIVNCSLSARRSLAWH